EKPQLTAITTPSGSHAVMGMRAIRAGSHILLEKPLTLSLSEADQLLETAREHNVRIAVGHIYRFFPVVAELQKDLQSGNFGRILYGDVKVRWGHDQAYYDQAAWRGTWSHDGGALMNQSIHALDLMVWLLGQPVCTVSGRIDRQLHRMQAEDFGLASLELANGIWCQLEGTTNTDPKRQEASFFIRCTEGEIRAGIMSGKPYMKIINGEGKNISWKYLRAFLVAKWREGRLAALKQLGNPHSGLYGDWIAAASSDTEPLADGKRAAMLWKWYLPSTNQLCLSVRSICP
ncbi:MAG: Gfo/Idh/MocA family oxidoreductase, partial [Clostridiaceae bacterium]|nr:Gfo/Idh/MocA family oxidoreductase [Clostridiaceae bacterium]